MSHRLRLVLLNGAFAVCRLAPDAPIPSWACGGSFASITRTAEELSVVCHEGAIPVGVQCERGWRCLRVVGTLDFSLVGVLASLVGPLAEAGVSVFVTSTFDTDYLLLKEEKLEAGVEALLRAGHAVERDSGEE
jgi:hypothetical protein